MKKNIKLLLLVAMATGVMVGCNDTTSTSNNTSSSDTSLPSDSRSGDNPSTSIPPVSSTSSSSTSVAPTLTGITLDTANVKKTYEQGEKLDLTGLVVTANYSDNTTEVVTNYTTNPANGATLNNTGAIPVTIAYGTVTNSFSVIVSKPSKKAWTDAEAKIMSNHLYGYVLPFTGSEAAVVAYDEENDAVTIQGGTADATALSSYAAKIVADGFKNVNPNGYVYEKEVTVNTATRHLRVAFANVESRFYLEAYDPYYYTFPTAFASEIAAGAFGSNEVPPAFNADYYEVSSSDYGIYCYTNTTDALDTYTTALNAANWNVLDELNQGFKVAISPDGKYCVNYDYNAEYKSLDIFFGPLSYWNTKVIEDFYNKYNGYVVNIPALNVTNGEYIFKESDVNEQAYAYGVYEAIHAFMYVYGANEQDLVSYADSIKTSGWEVEKYGNIYYAYLTIADKGIARLEFEYSAKYNAAIFTIYYKLDPIPLANWPTDEIKTLLGDYTIGTVPAFTGTNKGFVILNDMFGIGVLVKVERGTEDAAIEAYKTDLANAGYTDYDEDSTTYTNPNSEITIKVYSAEKGSITIDFAKTGKTKAFPSSLISSYFLGSDTVPALAGANGYEYKIVGEEDIQITCVYGAADAASSAQGQYMTLLQNAQYAFDSTTQKMVSKNNQFQIYFFVKDGSLVINVHGTPKSAFVSLWPTAKIAQLFASQGYTDELPSYDEICDDITADTNYDGSIFVLIEVDNKDQVKSDYMNLLQAANFTYDYASSTNYDDVFKSPNNQYTVAVSTNRFGVSLTIKKIDNGGQGESTFPMTRLVELFPGADGVLPSINNSNATYELDDSFSGEASLKVSFSSSETAVAVCAEYITALTTAQFTSETVWGMDVYVSPDRSFMVEVDDSQISNGYFTLYFMDTYGAVQEIRLSKKDLSFDRSFFIFPDI